MSDEAIAVSVTDRVDSGIAVKFNNIATSARAAYTGVQQLQTMLNSLNGGGLAQLTTQLKQSATAMSALQQSQAAINAANAQATITLSRLTTAQAAAATAQQRLATAQTNTTTAAQKLATEQQRTAKATADTAAANDRAALSALRLKQAQDQQAASTKNASTTMMDYVKSAVAFLGISMSIKQLFESSDTYTLLENKLRSVNVAEQDLTFVMNKLTDASLETRTGLEKTATTFQRMMVATHALGMSQSEVLDITSTLTKQIQMSGASAGAASAGLYQLAEGMEANRLQGIHLKALITDLPMLAQALAKAIPGAGDIDGLRKMGKAGELTADVMVKAIQKIKAETDGGFGRSVSTVAAGFAGLTTQFVRFTGQLNNSYGVTNAFNGVLAAIGQNIGPIIAVVAGLGTALFLTFGAPMVAMIQRATVAVLEFSLALLANPIGIIAGLIVGAATAMVLFGDEVKVTSDGLVTLKDVGRTAWAYIGDAMTYFQTQLSTTGTFLNVFIENFKTSWGQFFDIIGPPVKTALNYMIGAFVLAYQNITIMWKLFPAAMGAVFKEAANFGITAVETLLNAWQIGFRGIASLVGTLKPELAKSMTDVLDSTKIEIPKFDVSTAATDLQAQLKTAFKTAIGTDYIGNATSAFMDRATAIAKARTAALPDNGGRFTAKPDAHPSSHSGDEDKKAQKAAESRALSMAKINDSLAAEAKNMFLVNPQREISQKFDDIEIQLAGKKIKLNDDEQKSIRDKIAANLQNKEVQQQMDAIYSDTTGAINQYGNQLRAADILLAQGAITGQQYATAVNKAGEAYKTATDPLYSFNQGIEEQAKIYGQVGPAQEIERQVIAKQNELRKEGKSLTDAQTQSMRDQLAATQQLADVNQLLNGYYNNSTGKQKELTNTQTALNQAYAAGYVGTEQYGIQLQKLAVDTANLKMQMGDATFADALNAGMGNFVSNYTGVMSGLSAAWGDFFTNFNNGFADSIGKAIVQGGSLSDALAGVAQQVTAGLISALIKLGIQYVVNAALGTSLTATSLATATGLSVAAAGITAAAWAPAATMVSLASFGTNSAAAMAGIAATSAMSSGLAMASMAGFKAGGYTGNMSTSAVAGVVHGGEYVMTADTTSRLGVDALDALQNGGSVASTNANASGGGSGSSVNNFYFNFQQDISATGSSGDSSADTLEKSGEAISQKVQSDLMDSIRSGGVWAKIIKATANQ